MNDLAVEIVKAVVLIVTGGGLFSGIVALRKDRREEPKDKVVTLDSLLGQAVKASSTAMEALSKGTEAKVEAAAAIARAEAAETAARHSQQSAAESSARAEKAEQTIMVFRNVVVKHVANLVKWVDAGAPPPPPAIEQELRDFVNELNDA